MIDNYIDIYMERVTTKIYKQNKRITQYLKTPLNKYSILLCQSEKNLLTFAVDRFDEGWVEGLSYPPPSELDVVPPGDFI